MTGFSKKGTMGVGMLIIFISSILVAAVAAGVMIRSTGMLQQRALEVEESARERLVNKLDIIAVEAICNLSSETVMGFEFISRLSEGSYPLDINEIGMTFNSEAISASALFWDSDTISNCTYENLRPEWEFCFTEVFGDGNRIIKEGELIRIIYKLNSTNYLSVNENFETSFIPTRGTIVDLYLRTPKVLNRAKERIRA